MEPCIIFQFMSVMSDMRERIRRRPAVAALALGLVTLGIYLIGFQYTEGSGDAAPHELLPIVLLEHGNFYFDDYAGKDRPLLYFYVESKGHVISFYPIVPGLLNVPAALIGKVCGMDLYARRYLLAKWTAAVVTAASVSFMFLALVRVCSRFWIAVGLALVYACCTTVWSTASLCLLQHGPSLLFLTSAMALLGNPQSRWMPFCGFFLGMAVFNHPANALFALPIAIYMVLHHRQRLIPFIASALVPAILMALYSHYYWGSILALGQGLRWEGTLGPHYTHFHGPLFGTLAGHLFSPGRGLFVFSPVFLFSVPMLFWVLFSSKANPLHRYLVIGALADLVLYAKWSIWWGGWSFGYRLLTEMVPVLTLMLALGWERFIVRYRSLQALLLATVLLSAYFHFLGVYFPSDWNVTPTNIDTSPQRLWDWHDTALGRSQMLFCKSLHG